MITAKLSGMVLNNILSMLFKAYKKETPKKKISIDSFYLYCIRELQTTSTDDYKLIMSIQQFMQENKIDIPRY